MVLYILRFKNAGLLLIHGWIKYEIFKAYLSNSWLFPFLTQPLVENNPPYIKYLKKEYYTIV